MTGAYKKQKQVRKQIFNSLMPLNNFCSQSVDQGTRKERENESRSMQGYHCWLTRS